MQNQILIVTSSNDLTSDYIIRKFHNVNFFRLNLDLFNDYEITVTKQDVKFVTLDKILYLSEIISIYYRKPNLPNLDGIISEEYHSFAHKEIFTFIEGIIESFNGICISKPSVLRRANNKIFQLFIATKFGFKIPDSKITNSKSECLNFQNSQLIVKPISIGTVIKNDKKEVVQTSLFNENISLDYLRYCPAYFQRYINKEYEIRITFVGVDFWSVKIISENNIDWRSPENIVSYEKIDVPKKLINSCIKMLGFLELSFGCFDFLFYNGDYYFLELNANGQWAWLEKKLDLNISNKIIERLLKHEAYTF